MDQEVEGCSIPLLYRSPEALVSAWMENSPHSKGFIRVWGRKKVTAVHLWEAYDEVVALGEALRKQTSSNFDPDKNFEIFPRRFADANLYLMNLLGLARSYNYKDTTNDGARVMCGGTDLKIVQFLEQRDMSGIRMLQELTALLEGSPCAKP